MKLVHGNVLSCKQIGLVNLYVTGLTKTQSRHFLAIPHKFNLIIKKSLLTLKEYNYLLNQCLPLVTEMISRNFIRICFVLLSVLVSMT